MYVYIVISYGTDTSIYTKRYTNLHIMFQYIQYYNYMYYWPHKEHHFDMEDHKLLENNIVTLL